MLYPLINGTRVDWSCAKIAVIPLTGGPTILIQGIKSLNYKHELSPGEVRGNHSQLIGRTRGKYSASGSMEMYKDEYLALIYALGTGYLEKVFDISAMYSVLADESDAAADVLVGCRIMSSESSPSEGEEALTVKSDLSIMYLVEDGNFPLSVQAMLR